MKKIEIELTELQEKFVEAFCGEALFNPIKAYEMAGYAHTTKPFASAMAVLNSKAVTHHIHLRLADMKTNYWLTEDIVLQRLWKEAIDEKRGSTHAARINALVWIGKHLGMWQEKVEEKDSKPVINITNYGVSEEEMKKKINNTPEVEEVKDEVNLPEGVQVINYSEKNTH